MGTHPPIVQISLDLIDLDEALDTALIAVDSEETPLLGLIREAGDGLGADLVIDATGASVTRSEPGRG